MSPARRLSGHMCDITCISFMFSINSWFQSQVFFQLYTRSSRHDDRSVSLPNLQTSLYIEDPLASRFWVCNYVVVWWQCIQLMHCVVVSEGPRQLDVDCYRVCKLITCLKSTFVKIRYSLINATSLASSSEPVVNCFLPVKSPDDSRMPVSFDAVLFSSILYVLTRWATTAKSKPTPPKVGTKAERWKLTQTADRSKFYRGGLKSPRL